MGYINKIGLMLGATSIITLMATSNVFATNKGIIASETVRMRSEPSQDSSIVTLISLDEEVEIKKEDGDWYKVTYDGKTGYVSKDLVKTDKKEESKSEQKEEPKKETENKKEETNKDESTNKDTEKSSLEIKEGVSTTLSKDVSLKLVARIDSCEVGKIKKNKKITISQVLNDWCYIETDSQSGWIRNAVLQKAIKEDSKNDKKEENKEEKNTDKAGYVNTESVYVRKDADKSSEVVDSLVKGDKVIIIGEKDNWYHVEVNGKKGYIATEYISDKKPETTSRSSTESRKELKEENNSTKNENTKKETNKKSTKKSTSSSSKTTGSKIAQYAKKFIGCKYVSGGNSPSSGFDCSGFTCYVYKHFGISLNRTSSGQMSNGKSVSRKNIQVGDLLIFNNSANNRIGHVGIYIGGNRFVHAANSTKGVITTSLSDSYYSKRLVGIKRLI